MIIYKINGGVYFKPLSQKEAIFIINNYQAIRISPFLFIPSKLKDYANGYNEGEDYNYEFSKLKADLKYYSLRKDEIITGVAGGMDIDGIYIYDINKNIEILATDIEYLSIISKPQPIHKEIVDITEKLIETNNEVITAVEGIVSSINSISDTITTTPAVNGSPLNATQDSSIQPFITSVNNAKEKINVAKNDFLVYTSKIKEK